MLMPLNITNTVAVWVAFQMERTVSVYKFMGNF